MLLCKLLSHAVSHAPGTSNSRPSQRWRSRPALAPRTGPGGATGSWRPVTDVPEIGRTGRNRLVIPVTCTTHGGTPGFTNLILSKRNGTIVLDPHAIGACVITLDEAGATALRNALIEWLR